MDNKFYVSSKAKTFRKNSDRAKVFEWLNQHIETNAQESPLFVTSNKYVVIVKTVR